MFLPCVALRQGVAKYMRSEQGLQRNRTPPISGDGWLPDWNRPRGRWVCLCQEAEALPILLGCADEALNLLGVSADVLAKVFDHCR